MIDIKAIRNRAELGRPTRITEVKALLAEIERLNAELAQAVEDLYKACKCSPCNNGICVKKNCAGNIIPCEFEWRGAERGE